MNAPKNPSASLTLWERFKADYRRRLAKVEAQRAAEKQAKKDAAAK